MVDRALISGVSEEQILDIKEMEIGKKVQVAIQKERRDPENFKNLISEAIHRLEFLIGNELEETITIKVSSVKNHLQALDYLEGIQNGSGTNNPSIMEMAG